MIVSEMFEHYGDCVVSVAHSQVLAEASSMLRDTMSQQSQEAHITLQLPDLGSAVIEVMLSFLYQGEIQAKRHLGSACRAHRLILISLYTVYGFVCGYQPLCW